MREPYVTKNAFNLSIRGSYLNPILTLLAGCLVPSKCLLILIPLQTKSTDSFQHLLFCFLFIFIFPLHIRNIILILSLKFFIFLTCNSHTIKFTRLKHTIESVFSIFTDLCDHNQTEFQNIFVSPKRNTVPIINHSPSSHPTHPSEQLLIYFLFF